MADELRQVIERGRQARDDRAVDLLPPLIMEFHEVVARASGNSHLAQMLRDLLQKIAWGFELDIVGRIESSWADHSAIAEAILAGSGPTAGYLMGEHIIKDERLYRQAIERSDAQVQTDLVPPPDRIRARVIASIRILYTKRREPCTVGSEVEAPSESVPGYGAGRIRSGVRLACQPIRFSLAGDIIGGPR